MPSHVLFQSIFPFSLRYRARQKLLQLAVRQFWIMNSIEKVATSTTGDAGQEYCVVISAKYSRESVLKSIENHGFARCWHAVLSYIATGYDHYEMPREGRPA